MPWFPLNVSVTLIWFLLFWNTGTTTESSHREKRVAVLGTTEIPAASVDLSQFNFTDLVNGMLSKALKGAKKFFSFLSVTSYSSMAFHKVSIFVYNISNIKYVDYQKFPMRYCYCLNNRTNDLTDYTVLLLDIVGNTTSSLKELFKSTSIVSVSQSNESDCIYFCVMTGRTGRNLSDLWDLTQKPPIINFTFPKNDSSYLDLESILPNLITSVEETEMIMDPPKELWTLKTATMKPLEDTRNEHKMPATIKSTWSSAPSSRNHDISTSSSPQDMSTKGLGILGSSLAPVTRGLPSKGQSISFTKLSPWSFGDASKGNDFIPTRTPMLMESIVPKGQHQPSEKISLFPQNAFKEHSISFSSHKTQEGSHLKLPEPTTITALEMLERPYSVIPLWIKTDHKTVGKPNGISSSQQPTRSQPAISRTQTDRSFSRISSPSEEHIPPGGSEALQASVFTMAKTTAPLNQISSTKLPVMQDSVAFHGQDLLTKRDPISQQTRGKMDEIPSSIVHTFLSSTGTVPRVKPLSIDGHKMAVYTYMQSRCLQAKAAPTSPSITLVFQKVNPCVMELCRFFHQCLCVSQEQYSRHKMQRHCTSYYTWYLRNATYICEKFKRNSHTRTLRQKCLVNICKSI